MNEKTFFKAWTELCDGDENKKNIINAWDRPLSEFTNVMIGKNNQDSIINKLKEKLNESNSDKYELHQEYYSCDAVFYKERDKVTPIPLKKNSRSHKGFCGVFLKNIQIHLEHENDIQLSWQEIAQLCVIPGNELNVLVTYPDNDEEETNKGLLDIYSSILTNCELTPKILVIFGFAKGECQNRTGCYWKGFKWNGNAFEEIAVSEDASKCQ